MTAERAVVPPSRRNRRTKLGEQFLNCTPPVIVKCSFADPEGSGVGTVVLKLLQLYQTASHRQQTVKAAQTRAAVHCNCDSVGCEHYRGQTFAKKRENSRSVHLDGRCLFFCYYYYLHVDKWEYAHAHTLFFISIFTEIPTCGVCYLVAV